MKQSMNLAESSRHGAAAAVCPRLRFTIRGLLNVCVFISGFMFAGCAVTGNGVMREVSYVDCPTLRLKVDGNWTVNMTCNAPENRVVIAAEDNIWDAIDLTCSDGELRIHNSGFQLKPTLPMTVNITTTSGPDRIELFGAVSAVVDGMKHNCDISLENASKLTLKNCDMRACSIRLINAAEMTVSGEIGKIDFVGGNVSHFTADDCIVDSFTGTAANNSRIRLGEVETVTATMSNASSLRIANLTRELKGNAANTAEVLVGGPGETGSFQVRENASLTRLVR